MTVTRRSGEILAIGFGTTVAMWGAGYVARLPVVLAPPAVVLAALLMALLAGGYVAGASGTRGVRGGAYAGALTGLLNLLVLGSFLSTHDRTNALVPSAALWVPGSIALSAAIAAAGAWIGGLRRRTGTVDWTAAFARVAVAATFLLLVVGGVVTSNQAGLAVVDWPRSYGYNMFLYPFSRMTGGIYYEHAHRLFGALVGLTTATLAVHVARVESRGWVKRLAFTALALVIVQGTLGGLRVTETNLYLAVVHGVTAQVFFALLVVIAIVLSPTWTGGRAPEAGPTVAGDRLAATLAVVALLVQIALGAIQRHLGLALMLHIGMAFVAAGLAITAGARAWGLHQGEPVLKRAGLIVIYASGFQLMLGFMAWAARGASAHGSLSSDWTIVVTTMHQGMGALLLASAVALRAWTSRLIAPEPTSGTTRPARRTPDR